MFIASTAALTLPVTAIVTERERLLVALAASERGFRRMVEASIAGIVQFDSAGSLNFVNHRWTELTGLSHGDSIGEGWLSVFDDAARACVRALPSGARCGDATVEPLPYRQPDGGQGWAEISCSLERDEAGAIVGHVCRLVDVTARHQAELVAGESAAMLRKTNRLLLMAEELADVGHWRVGLSRGDFDYSTQASVIGGVHGSVYLDLRQALALLDPAGRSALLRCVVRVRRGGTECEASARLRRPDGELRQIVLRIQAERRDGALAGLFGVISDVTAKVAAESALIAARDAAQSAARAKSEFVATMSHEIRTPMTGVLGMIDLLRDDPDCAERGEYLEAMKQSADLLMAVLDNVLDFSLVESGKLALKLRDFDVEAVAQATVSMFVNAASRKGLLLSLAVDAGNGSIARGDPVRLQQVLSNLIANAVKFTTAGAIDVAVRARPLRSGAKHWLVTVRDTGPGIPDAERSALFQPFIQAQSVARMGGTGLGLAISRSLIDAMGGTIGVQSTPGSGSTFWFELDLPVGSAARLPDLGRPGLAPMPRALDVLLAEDNA
ncbi:MAG: ATP-binding protein, partial [Sphingomicrobium sp.]